MSYVPLAIQLVSTDFGEVRSAIEFLTGGGEPAPMSLPVRIVVIALRVLAWPLTGLLTEAPVAAILAAAASSGRSSGGPSPGRRVSGSPAAGSG